MLNDHYPSRHKIFSRMALETAGGDKLLFLPPLATPLYELSKWSLLIPTFLLYHLPLHVFPSLLFPDSFSSLFFSDQVILHDMKIKQITTDHLLSPLLATYSNFLLLFPSVVIFFLLPLPSLASYLFILFPIFLLVPFCPHPLHTSFYFSSFYLLPPPHVPSSFLFLPLFPSLLFQTLHTLFPSDKYLGTLIPRWVWPMVLDNKVSL